ncbi:sigma factor-like helix-turn-helix DNA-binding protein [Alicyclobacillus acidocaldarius]|uniref:Transcriptional regulator, LuxR family n=1 Tax=Alicyclobacillus acidocaldarius subsp. acidocaldarius (strain ATCC 27009 / DSM 446 / BCRC 14685 / JCM 5260 / KCTC 1825 / NBRC 15652 / NCIMB 11725 / NRRL B-14509 / 104-IA) TaxID=521098 RepID=C8WWQ5_ALIAD|nr:sigma factor-like helix-turn-helix DNA-binding protein [Alicyclobacillus acidocaldarius]ACV58526.1 transcriptional regulator, LuxR family [Alicyclobacillus acidocaldarius subsp. acidocaldarius DSM 446]
MRRDLDDLIAQYESTRESIREARNRARREQNDHDAALYDSMVKTLDYALAVMEGEYRAPRREVLVGDLADLDRLAARRRRWGAWDEADGADEEEERLPVAWLSFLSLREAACLFAYERGMTYSAIARELGITRGAVQNYVERAREKLVRVEGVQLGLWGEEEGGNVFSCVE